MTRKSFTPVMNVLAQLVVLNVFFLFIMTLFRTAFFFLYRSVQLPVSVYGDLFEAFVLGFRLDLSITGYLLAVPVLLLMIARLLPALLTPVFLQRIFRLYYIVVFLLASFLLAADAANYSYFKEHITMMIFGVFDDDTQALWRTAVENYNMPLIALKGVIYVTFIAYATSRILSLKLVQRHFSLPVLSEVFVYCLLTLSVILMARGSLGMYPVYKMITDISPEPFVNQLPQNGVHAFIQAEKDYANSKSEKYDLIKEAGYSGRINEAFESYLGKSLSPGSDLQTTLIRSTPENDLLATAQPHVVVVMMESFGMPVLAHQSETFDIMGRLKRHFDEDIVFKNFISSSNGTISSLEPLLLNFTARPLSTSFSQSEYMSTSFESASARVYQNAGYETSFIYGGDLSWRNTGVFFARQGFDHVEGKANILATLSLDENTAVHDWGVFDEHSYDYVIQKLKNATQSQFIFLLTTNNHPPYRIPTYYRSRSLVWPEALIKQLTGDDELAHKRIRDYAYALDMAGRFLDKLKASPFSGKTIVGLTADNNTIEGIMHYKDPITESKLVPFYLYTPEAMRPYKVDTAQPGSHKDIFPTLYNLSLSNSSYLSVGSDLLDDEVLHCGFNDEDIIISNGGAFVKDEPESELQKRCNDYYKATLAVTEYLVITHKSKFTSE